MTDQFVITNASLFTAVDGEVIRSGALWVDGTTIRYAGPEVDLPDVQNATTRVDLGGRFLMPGMTESHVHLSYADAAPTDLDQASVPQAMLDAAQNARMVLAAGFTSAISFGSAQGIDVPLRNAIERGRLPGPRLAASERDVGSTGSNADSARPGSDSHKLIVDGPWEVRRAVRGLAKATCDIVKLFLDGEAISDHAPPGVLTYTDEEVAAAVQEAHARNMRVVCHSRSAAAVKQAVRHGVDIVGHANYLDDEAVDMLHQARHRLAVGPGIAWEVALLDRGHEIGLPRAAMEQRGYQREVDETVSAVKRLRDAGVRVLVGGDYGLNITPHGTNARDLQYFVELFGMSPTEALLCATRDGGAVADPTGMVGTLEAGKYADFVVVDGDPTQDIAVLQELSRITSVVKGGAVHRGLSNHDPYKSAPGNLG